MIPLFPKFKRLELLDWPEIKGFTDDFLPYSDFNFVSLWSWNTDNERMISVLNGNLVVLFTDYNDNRPFFSFIGTHLPSETALALIDFAERNSVEPTLKFVPRESAELINKESALLVKEDEDNFDYIFSISKLADLQGSEYKSKRHSADKFFRDNPDVRLEVCSLSDSAMRSKITLTANKWSENKLITNETHDFSQERGAISRLMQLESFEKLIVTCAFLKEEMIAFSVDEVQNKEYAISHFFKTNHKLNGLSDHFNREIAKYLEGRGVTMWNWEQDLGFESLRKSKNSYRPINLLKKFSITLTSNA